MFYVSISNYKFPYYFLDKPATKISKLTINAIQREFEISYEAINFYNFLRLGHLVLELCSART